MINLNVVARIAEDKNSFPDLLYALHNLKQHNNNKVRILFIGPIQSDTVYNQLITMAAELDVSSSIAFTKTAIPIDKLTDDLLAGYFINFSIGNFIGYSALESIKKGLKTICYNVDKTLEFKTSSSVSQCANLSELIALIEKIIINKSYFDKEILADNGKLFEKFRLDTEDKKGLLAMMKASCI